MNSLDAILAARLGDLRNAGLHRELRRIDSAQATHLVMKGKPCLNFSSNDYLGFANHPKLKDAATKAIDKYGVGSGASRLICGSLAPHHELEESLADFKDCESALTFSSGYAAAMGTICALMGKDDIIILDKLVHACIVDAAKLSGAKLRIFAHNDLDSLAKILAWSDQRKVENAAKTTPRILIITESVFSMDGDLAPLREIVELKEKHGAWLMVDEAHATGLFGKKYRGLIEQLGLSGRVEVQMGTMGKALGSSGGFITGSKTLIEYLINRARSFIFSTAPTPASSAAASAALLLLRSEEGKQRNEHLWRLIHRATESLAQHSWQISGSQSAILPLIIGDETDAVKAFHTFQQNGFFIPAVRYPTVGRGKARLRLTLTASHTEKEVDDFLACLYSTIPVAPALSTIPEDADE